MHPLMMLYIIFCDIHSFCAYMYFHLQVKYKLYRGGVKSDILVTRAFVGKLAGGWLRVVFCLVDCHERHRWLPLWGSVTPVCLALECVKLIGASAEVRAVWLLCIISSNLNISNLKWSFDTIYRLILFNVSDYKCRFSRWSQPYWITDLLIWKRDVEIRSASP